MLNISSYIHNNKTYLFYGFVCVFLVVGIQAAAMSQVSYSVEFYSSDISFTTITAEDGIDYEKVTIPDLKQTDEIGKPNLLVKYVKLIVPADHDIEEIALTHIQTKDLPGFHLIFPTQPGVPISDDYKKLDFVPPDSTIYESNDPYPSKIVSVRHDGYFDGSNHIVTLAVYPIQYYPKSGRLVFFSYIDFLLKMKPSETTKSIVVQKRSEKNQKIYDAILKKIVNNPEDIPRYQVKPQLIHSTIGKSASSVPIYEYIIITNNSLKDEFDNFVSWKRRKGLDIGVVTVEDIYPNYTAGDQISGINDNAGSVRQYLWDAYDDDAVWVLLAGDHTIVPVRYGCGGDNSDWNNYNADSEYRIPADLYFADFTGDWNEDGTDSDGAVRYGEVTDDDPDYNPEIFVGRLPCTSAQDIAYWVEKVLKYEQNPGNGDDSYLKNAFWIKGNSITVHPDYIKTHCPSAFIHTVWDQSPTHKGSEVVAEMSDEYGLINWHCHGAPIHMSVKPAPNRFVWTKDDYCYSGGCSDETGDGLDNMTNDKYYSVVYSICCDIAAFDDFKSTDYPGRCMAEGFTCFFDHRGGPELLGNTRLGKQTSSPELQKEFYDLLDAGTSDPGSGESYFHLGVSELVSKDNYTGSDDHYLAYSHNLFGCPETQIWTDEPSAFTSVSITDNTTSITVNAGVSGCDICACSGNNGASYHSLVTNKTSYTFNTSVRPLYITITKHNYIPYTAVTGGTFTTDEIWFGNLYVYDHLTISNSSTLTILSGTTVKFLNGSGDGINVNSGSKIIAEGTSSDHIKFTSKNSSSEWKGILAYSSNNHFKYCDFEYSSNDGLKLYGSPSQASNNIVEYCSFKNNGNAGLVVKNNYNPLIKHCRDIYNNGAEGIHLEMNQEVKIEDTWIISNDEDGICSEYNDELLLYECLIKNNSGDGIYSYMDSYIDLSLDDSWGGGNSIHDNYHNVAIHYFDGMYIYMDWNSDLPNSIYDLSPYTGYEVGIWNSSGICVQAEEVYWGDNASWYGNVDHDYPLESDQTGLPKGGTRDFPLFSGNKRTDENPKDREADIPEEELKEIVENEPNSETGVDALGKLHHQIRRKAYKTKNRALEMELVNYLEGLYTSKKSTMVGKKALTYLVRGKMRQDKYTESIDLCKEGLEFLESENLKTIEETLTWLYIHTLQFEKAQTALDDLRTSYGDIPACASYIDHLEEMLVDNMDQDDLLKPEEFATETTLPEEVGLSQNYPNPGNPTTTICFRLPEANRVVLRVVNILGQEVKTLVDDHREVGSYTVIWDGKNNRGLSVPSGIYLYTLKAGDKVVTKKLILLK